MILQSMAVYSTSRSRQRYIRLHESAEWFIGERMQLIAMSCDHCGAPLSVPDGAQLVICTYCGARLEVHRNDGGADLAGSSREQKSGGGISTPGKSIDDRIRLAQDQPDNPMGWQIVASFKLIHDWHQAARALSRAGIMARMQDDSRDASYSALAVPAPNAETARQLLSQPGQSASPGG
jgi:LSD1 subclass zinc finger protein